MADNNSIDNKTEEPVVVTDAPAPTEATSANPEPAQNPQPNKKPNKAVAIGIFIVIGVLALLGLGIGGGMWLQNTLSPTSTSQINSGTDGNTAITAEESSIAAVVDKVNPSVVSIVGTAAPSYGTAGGQAAGTGIIVSTDGYVLTNNHVVEGARSLSVVDSEGNKYSDVSLVGRDPLNDVAFLKINANVTFKAAELGNSSTIRIGQQVVAIGNALGQYSNTVTSGIISGTGRPVTASSGDGRYESLTDLIQTDASINPGNSGGPLVNMAGQVIGINTAIVEDANGIGFAIPINATKGILAGVLETGKVERAYMGVNYVSITPDVADEYDLPVNEGAYIFVSGGGNPVASGSPADKAGLQEGDIITKVNDVALGKAGGLSSVIGQYRVGDAVTITYLRDGQTHTTQLTFSDFDR